MLHILSIVLPVFGLIAIGYGARRAKLVLDRTGDGLSDFVFTIAVPALIFKTLTAADLPQSQPWGRLGRSDDHRQARLRPRAYG
jgi:hypothetical protein